MIKAEASNGKVSLELSGTGLDVTSEIMTMLSIFYEVYESAMQGSGEWLMLYIADAIRRGKIQEWSKVTGDE